MTAILTRPAAGLTDRQLIAAASRALREAGMTADLRTRAAWRNGRADQLGHLVTWTVHPASGEWVLEIWRRIAGRDDYAEIAVTSVQQAIDVVAALTGIGVHLTTGARLAGGGR